MNSSYNNKVTFGDVLESIVFAVNPRSIVEVGILDGFSLKCFADSSSKDTVIRAYDIFEEFNGNHADKETLTTSFEGYNNVLINRGDFYKVHSDINDIDIIHIDIANNGDVYEYAIKHYLPKLSEKGILIMEGGSMERDNVEWMPKYNKPKIQPIIEEYRNRCYIKTIGRFPSVTLIRPL